MVRPKASAHLLRADMIEGDARDELTLTDLLQNALKPREEDRLFV